MLIKISMILSSNETLPIWIYTFQLIFFYDSGHSLHSDWLTVSV